MQPLPDFVQKEFFRIYGTSPHQWLIRQRLIHARLLLISTDKAIAEIGTACAFPNTSHFIKLFRKQYGMTPATYRNRHRGPEELQPTPQAEAAVRETAVSVTA
ncbi:MAG: helix-turn-helix transcriptional regulator [Alistipes putredinis]